MMKLALLVALGFAIGIGAGVGLTAHAAPASQPSQTSDQKFVTVGACIQYEGNNTTYKVEAVDGFFVRVRADGAREKWLNLSAFWRIDVLDKDCK